MGRLDAATQYDQNDVVGPLRLTDTLRDASQAMGLSMWFELTVVAREAARRQRLDQYRSCLL